MVDMTGPQSSVAVLPQLGDRNRALSSPPAIMTIACASAPFPSSPISALRSAIYPSPQLTFNIFLPLLPSYLWCSLKVTRHSCCFFSCPQHSLDPCAAFPRPPMFLVWDFLCFLLDGLHRPGVMTKWYAHMMLWFTITLLSNGIPGPTCHCNLRTAVPVQRFSLSPFPSGWHFPCLSESALSNWKCLEFLSIIANPGNFLQRFSSCPIKNSRCCHCCLSNIPHFLPSWIHSGLLQKNSKLWRPRRLIWCRFCPRL